MLLAFAIASPCQSPEVSKLREVPQVRFAEVPDHVRLATGPLLLHARIRPQWGGHTFSYLLEGPDAAYWSALAGPTGPALVGRHPAPGSLRPAHVTEIDLSTLAPSRVDQPQLLRTPDGRLHAFVSVFSGEDERGEVRYFAGRDPDGIEAFDDRSTEIPHTRFPSLHANRKNVGLDREGRRAVLFALSDYLPGVSLMNTPLLFLGRVGEDRIHFDEPIVLGEPVPFFYPQVAATEQGIVLLGAVDHDPSRHAELWHVDWQGRELHREELPHPEGTSLTWAFEMEPFDPRDWGRLLIVRAILPEGSDVRTLEFWSYDTRARELTRLRSLDNHIEQEPGFTNAGQVWSEAGHAPLFVNEPGSSSVAAWEGDLSGNMPFRIGRVPGTAAREFGFTSIRSVFLTSVLQGSAPAAGRRAFAFDLDLPRAVEGEDNPCAWLLGWLERTP